MAQTTLPTRSFENEWVATIYRALASWFSTPPFSTETATAVGHSSTHDDGRAILIDRIKHGYVVDDSGCHVQVPKHTRTYLITVLENGGEV